MEQEKIIAEINALKEANRELSKILNEVIRQVMDNNELCSKFIEENGIIKAFFPKDWITCLMKYLTRDIGINMIYQRS